MGVAQDFFSNNSNELKHRCTYIENRNRERRTSTKKKKWKTMYMRLCKQHKHPQTHLICHPVTFPGFFEPWGNSKAHDAPLFSHQILYPCHKSMDMMISRLHDIIIIFEQDLIFLLIHLWVILKCKTKSFYQKTFTVTKHFCYATTSKSSNLCFRLLPDMLILNIYRRTVSDYPRPFPRSTQRQRILWLTKKGDRFRWAELCQYSTVEKQY